MVLRETDTVLPEHDVALVRDDGAPGAHADFTYLRLPIGGLRRRKAGIYSRHPAASSTINKRRTIGSDAKMTIVRCSWRPFRPRSRPTLLNAWYRAESAARPLGSNCTPSLIGRLSHDHHGPVYYPLMPPSDLHACTSSGLTQTIRTGRAACTASTTPWRGPLWRCSSAARAVLEVHERSDVVR